MQRRLLSVNCWTGQGLNFQLVRHLLISYATSLVYHLYSNNSNWKEKKFTPWQTSTKAHTTALILTSDARNAKEKNVCIQHQATLHPNIFIVLNISSLQTIKLPSCGLVFTQHSVEAVKKTYLKIDGSLQLRGLRHWRQLLILCFIRLLLTAVIIDRLLKYVQVLKRKQLTLDHHASNKHIS